MNSLTMILCTHDRPKEAERVIGELLEQKYTLCDRIKMRITCVTHNIKDAPYKHKESYTHLVNKELGWAKSLDYGIRRCETDWFGFVNDDSLFPQRDWLSRAVERIKFSPYPVKLLGFNDGRNQGRWCSLGLCETQWYLEQYIIPQPYNHYGLDNEMKNIADIQGLWHYANTIRVVHDFDPNRVNRTFKRKDYALYKRRNPNFD